MSIFNGSGKGEVINPFEAENQAARYDRCRPQYHHIPFNWIRERVGYKFSSSLDVACGTGHSTVALATISDKVVGCDLSEEMLSLAHKKRGVSFVRADAKDLPFDDGSFDFVNISMGFHWVEQEKFLAEVRRVLKKSGRFCVDSYGFLGKISEDPAKQKLYVDLLKNFLPLVGRGTSYPSKEQTGVLGFQLENEFKYHHTVSLGAEEFASLLMTWSNFQAQSPERQKVTAARIREVCDQIFADRSLPLGFGGRSLLYLR